MKKEQLTDGSLGLCEHDGALCVTCCVADWNAPILHRHYWPTTVAARDLLAHMQVDSLADLHIEKSTPGEYAIRRKSDTSFPYTARLQLVNGARTQSVKCDNIEYAPPPRAREKEYRDGRWYVRRAGRMVHA